MAIRNDLSRKLSRLPERSWDELVGLWLSYPRAAATTGQAPLHELGELQQLATEMARLPKGQNFDGTDTDLGNVRETILKQSLFNLQKAAFTTRACCQERNIGNVSWSLSTAYHSSYFAAQGVLGLLGLAVIAEPNETFLVDVLSEQIPGMNKVTGITRFIRIMRTSKVEHKETWAILQALFRKTAGLPIPARIRDTISEHDPDDFARQRNQIHYRPKYWPFNEMCVTPLSDATYDEIKADIPDLLADPRDNAFSLALAVAMVHCGQILLASIVDLSEAFRPELDCVRVAIDKTFPEELAA